MTDITPALLFVYGTLRRGCTNDMARRLAAESHLLGPAYIGGHLYRINNPVGLPYPGLIPDDTGPPVTGDLIALNSPSATFLWLDVYEEVGPNFPYPQEYRRVLLPIRQGARLHEAWVYAYNWPIHGAVPIPGGEWPL